MNYWEIIADNLKKRGWSYGYVSAIDSNGRTIWIAGAHRDDGKPRAGEKLIALLDLEWRPGCYNENALAVGFCSARADFRELRPADAGLVRGRP